MNEPTRWLDDGASVPPGGRELLRHALPPKPMSAASRARATEHVAKMIAAAPAASWFGMGTMKIVAVIVAIGAAGGLAATTWPTTQMNHAHDGVSAPTSHATLTTPETRWSHAAVSDPAVVPAAGASMPIAIVSRPEQPSPLPSPQPLIASTHTRPHAARPEIPPLSIVQPADMPTAPVPAQPATTESEASWLSRAHLSLASDPAETLRELDALDRAYPAGALMEEREFLALSALHRERRDDEVRPRAAAFLERYGNGLFASRVRALLVTLH